ncbi:MAG TPA: DUF72 domain-containing protein [Acidimicrobiia bacterium]|nr:DUF72 domain-containing protein [Acidimicrobiia bacterium]
MLRIGTSGWQYRHWRNRFYPAKLPSDEWLEYYAARFDTVEVNNTFYRLPARGVFADWSARVPANFEFVIKASNYLTHYKRLLEPAEPVARLLERAEPLGSKLAVVLLQLPPNLGSAPDRLDETLRAFGGRVRVAVEPRHPSWFGNDVRAVLEQHGAALCWTDRGSRVQTPLWNTADWYYVRLHFGRSVPPSCYGGRALRSWIERLVEHGGADPNLDGFVFFNNDGHACALRDAVTLGHLAARAGIPVSSVPARLDVHSENRLSRTRAG